MGYGKRAWKIYHCVRSLLLHLTNVVACLLCFQKIQKNLQKNTTELLFTTTTLDIIQLSSTYYKYHKKLPKSHTTTMSNPALLDKKCLLPILLTMNTPSSGDSTY